MTKKKANKKGKPPYTILVIVFVLVIGLWLALELAIGVGMDSIQSDKYLKVT